MTPPKNAPVQETVAFAALDLKWSLTLRVVTAALLCFVIAAAISFVGTYREVLRANESFADIVGRQLQMQMYRIDANIDLRSRFPDWEPITARAQTAGQCNGSKSGNGLGLIGMRERVMALGGQLETGSCAERGFRLHTRIPFAAEQGSLL